jgi:nucleotide-binding universal stress UspA family protein
MTMARPDAPLPIVIGVHPDPARRMALAWAADEAARRGVPLRLVHAESMPTVGFAVSFAEARQPQVQVSGLLAEGDPAWILREQSQEATAVVLGSSHLSRVREMFGSSSVAVPVMAHARCPLVVVPEPEHATQQPAHFVVGVDGSAPSAAAVDFAFEEAALRGAALRALYVWQPGRLHWMFDEDAEQEEYRRVLSETVAGRGAAYPDVELHHELVSGHPVEVLTEASADALGLVVGIRGHGGFAGMLLGSVSQGVLHYARCPVIAVPHTSA